MRALIAFIITLMFCAGAHAHEVRPGYLEIDETATGAYDVTWKLPVSSEVRISLTPRLPEGCKREGEIARTRTGAAEVQRWRETCAAPINGRSIEIAGLERTITSVFVRATFLGGEQASGLARPAAPLVILGKDAPPPAPRYLQLGFEHILGGWDHLLFVIGLIVLIGNIGRLVRALTAFTLAHSITLGAAALGYAGLAARPVEAVIALSISAVGLEIVRRDRGAAGLTSMAPWAVAFGFGLLHGFGFAGALTEIGLPRNQELPALLFFNLGVEAGQLMVAAVVAPLFAAIRLKAPDQRARVELAAGYAIGCAGMYWVIERTIGALFL